MKQKLLVSQIRTFLCMTVWEYGQLYFYRDVICDANGVTTGDMEKEKYTELYGK